MVDPSAPDPEEPSQEEPLSTWRDRPLVELVHHIEVRYHRRLRRDLEGLLVLANDCRKRGLHGDLAGLHDLHRTLLALNDELLEHMAKEEHILFPWLLGANRRTAGAPIAAMQHDHRRASGLLARLRVLTDGFRSPPGACAGWCHLVLRLRNLACDLHDHMLLEDEVLFPRALLGT